MSWIADRENLGRSLALEAANPGTLHSVANAVFARVNALVVELTGRQAPPGQPFDESALRALLMDYGYRHNEIDGLSLRSIEATLNVLVLRRGRAAVRAGDQTKKALPADKDRKAQEPMTDRDPGLDHEDVSILTALNAQAPKLIAGSELESNANVSRKTVGKRLNELIARGLAERPKGKRGGATITARGKALLGKCPGPK
jgi:hypothetical protein